MFVNIESCMDLDGIFGALSSVPRRQILAFLSQTALSTTDLAGRFSLSPPAMSRHLAVLQRAGLVVSERQGQRVLYRLQARRAARRAGALRLRGGRPAAARGAVSAGRRAKRSSARLVARELPGGAHVRPSACRPVGRAMPCALSRGAAAAADAGVIAFQSAGSLQRSAPSEPFVPSGASASLTGELLFPEGDGPFPAVVLAHGCDGNRCVEPAWGRCLRQCGLRHLQHRQLSAVAASARSAPRRGAAHAAAARARRLRRAAAARGASEDRSAAHRADGLLARRRAHDARVHRLGEGNLCARRPAVVPRLLSVLSELQRRVSERNRVSAPRAHPHRRGRTTGRPPSPAPNSPRRSRPRARMSPSSVYPGALSLPSTRPGRSSTCRTSPTRADCFPQSPSILGPVVPRPASPAASRKAPPSAAIAVGRRAGAEERPRATGRIDEIAEYGEAMNNEKITCATPRAARPWRSWSSASARRRSRW